MPTIPLLKIFHISDIHFTATPAGSGTKHRTAARGHLTPPAYWQSQGTAGHESGALRALRRSVQGEASQNWEGRKLLAITGDLSTWGDGPSIESAKRWAERTAQVSNLPEPFIFYGNHDVWPGNPGLYGFPIFSSEPALASNRTLLRNRSGGKFPMDFPHTWQNSPPQRLTFSSRPNSWIRVAAYNSVVHEPLPNMGACGKLDADRYWETQANAPQLGALEVDCADDTLPLILLFSHHPFHDAQPWPKGMTAFGTTLPGPHVLLNHKFALRALEIGAGRRSGPRPVVIVMSGHTHKTWPRVGDLPTAELSGPVTRPKTLQLVTGSASQTPVGAPGVGVQSWQVVMLNHETNADLLILERIVYERVGGDEFLVTTGHSASVAERIEIPL